MGGGVALLMEGRWEGWPGKVRKGWGMRSKVTGKDRVDL